MTIEMDANSFYLTCNVLRCDDPWYLAVVRLVLSGYALICYRHHVCLPRHTAVDPSSPALPRVYSNVSLSALSEALSDTDLAAGALFTVDPHID